MRKQLVGLGLALLLLATGPASAQTPVVPGNFAAPAAPGQQQQWSQYSATNLLPVAASGFTPSASGATGTPLAVTGSSGTGYICLPTAYSGHWQIIANATGQTIDIYSSAASYVAGTADTINTSAGTSAYTGLTTHKTAICFAYANGAWACGSIS